jgi:hypothetical protein
MDIERIVWIREKIFEELKAAKRWVKEMDRARPAYKRKHPESRSYSYVPDMSSLLIKGNEKHNEEVSVKKAEIYTYACWRLGQGVYPFDPYLEKQLWNNPVDAAPAEVLSRLPQWAVMIPLPKESRFDVLLVTYRSCKKGDLDVPELILIPMRKDEDGDLECGLACLPLVPGTTIKQAILMLDLHSEVREKFGGSIKNPNPEKLFETIKEGYQKFSAHSRLSNADEIPRYVTLVLYLCAKNAEMHNQCPDQREQIPQRYEPKIIGGKPLVKVSDSPTVWDVGYRVGPAMQKAEEEWEKMSVVKRFFTGRHVRPHSRRAHFHWYRVGKGKQEWELKYLDQIEVGRKKDTDDSLMPVVVRQV